MKRTCTILLALGAAIGGAATAGAAARPHASGTPSVLTCAGKAVVKPTSYVLACADANLALNNIHWTNWGATSATGTATLHKNTCEPNCASGKFVNYPAKVTLSKPKSAKSGLLFSSVSYSYTLSASQSLPLTAIGSTAGAGA